MIKNVNLSVLYSTLFIWHLILRERVMERIVVWFTDTEMRSFLDSGW